MKPNTTNKYLTHEKNRYTVAGHASDDSTARNQGLTSPDVVRRSVRLTGHEPAIP
jgi:hypothetical protein